MNVTPTFALTILAANEVPNMLVTFPLTRYGWMESEQFITTRGGKAVAADSGVYYMVDFPVSSGKWQRAFIEYNALLSYVDLQRIMDALPEASLMGVEDALPSHKALWSQVVKFATLSFGVMFSEGYGEYSSGSYPDKHLTQVLLSPIFQLCDNEGVMVMSYRDKNQY